MACEMVDFQFIDKMTFSMQIDLDTNLYYLIPRMKTTVQLWEGVDMYITVQVMIAVLSLALLLICQLAAARPASEQVRCWIPSKFIKSWLAFETGKNLTYLSTIVRWEFDLPRHNCQVRIWLTSAQLSGKNLTCLRMSQKPNNLEAGLSSNR